jgi:hypothetical protein
VKAERMRVAADMVRQPRHRPRCFCGWTGPLVLRGVPWITRTGEVPWSYLLSPPLKSKVRAVLTPIRV